MVVGFIADVQLVGVMNFMGAMEPNLMVDINPSLTHTLVFRQ